MATKQTLKQAVELISTGAGLQSVTRCGLAGCAVGGWAETDQAKRRMADELPSARSYTLDQLIDALYLVDHAGRYQRRDR